jgi:hypothetical protein
MPLSRDPEKRARQLANLRPAPAAPPGTRARPSTVGGPRSCSGTCRMRSGSSSTGCETSAVVRLCPRRSWCSFRPSTRGQPTSLGPAVAGTFRPTGPLHHFHRRDRGGARHPFRGESPRTNPMPLGAVPAPVPLAARRDRQEGSAVPPPAIQGQPTAHPCRVGSPDSPLVGTPRQSVRAPPCVLAFPLRTFAVA